MTPLRKTLAVALVAALILLPSIPSASDSDRTGRTARFVELSNVDGFLGFFNLARGTVRFLALLSPDCPECVALFDEIHRVMESTPNRRLRAYLVYQPAGEGDTRERAFELVSRLDEPRVSHFWDPTRSVSEFLQPDDIAASRCYVFGTNALLTHGDRDAPALAMDPYAGGTADAFDGARLETAVAELLEELEAQQRGPAPRRE